MIKKLLLTYGLFALTFMIDFLTKQSAVRAGSYYKNEGVIMSAFAHLPVMVKSVYLSSIGFFLLAIFILMTLHFQFKTKKFYVGSSLLFSGIIGNVMDRVRYGFVVDFIHVQPLPVFNVADLIQLVGILLLFLCFRDELDFHLPLDSRRKLLIMPNRIQKIFIFQIFILFLCFSSVFYILSYVFIKYSLIETGFLSKVPLDYYLQSFILMFLTFSVLMSIVTVFILSIISRKIIGPVQAIEKYLDDTLEGKVYPFKLRNLDYYKSLEPKLTRINEEFKKND